MSRRSLMIVPVSILFALSACAIDSDSDLISGSDTSGMDDPTDERAGPLPDGGGGSCVESYSTDTLADRSFAFDGIVLATGSSVSEEGDESDLELPSATFEVREWYVGGTDDQVTVDMQTVTPSPEVPEPAVAYGIGSRLLISGEPRWGGSSLDAPIAWGCEFSRYYDEKTATTWRQTFEN